MAETTGNKKPLALALGAAFATSLSVAPAASSAENPFSMTDLGSGYMVAENPMEKGKKAMEGGAAEKATEGRCGGMKGMQGSCGGMMKGAEGMPGAAGAMPGAAGALPGAAAPAVGGGVPGVGGAMPGAGGALPGAAAPRTLRSVGATAGTTATGALAMSSALTRTADLDTGCDWANTVVGTATTAPGTRWLAYTTLVTLVLL